MKGNERGKTTDESVKFGRNVPKGTSGRSGPPVAPWEGSNHAHWGRSAIGTSRHLLPGWRHFLNPSVKGARMIVLRFLLRERR